MTRIKKVYIENNVYEEAKNRINHCLDLYDHVPVKFSGGKDSQVLLHLVKEVYDENGIDKPVPTIFGDSEFVDKNVLEMVNLYKEKEWVDLIWTCLQSKRDFITLGMTNPLVVWDPVRIENGNICRQPPEDAIWLPREQWETASQLDAKKVDDHFMADYFGGSVCALTGLRAGESINRLISSTQKTTDNYITNGHHPAVSMARPIYDWQYLDVWKYIKDHDLQYSKAYDLARFHGTDMRSGGHLVGMASYQELQNVQKIDPELYEKFLDMFPMARLQAEYGYAYDFSGQVKKWGKSYAKVRTWIERHVPEEYYEQAVTAFTQDMEPAMKSPSSYTPEIMMRAYLKGEFSNIQPMRKPQ